MCHVYAFSFRSNEFYNLIFIPSARIGQNSVCASRVARNEPTNERTHVKYNKILCTNSSQIIAKRIQHKTVEETNRKRMGKKYMWKQNPDRGVKKNVSRETDDHRMNERRIQVVSSLLNFVRIRFVMCARRMSVSGIWISFKFSPGLSAARHAQHTNPLATTIKMSNGSQANKRTNERIERGQNERTNERKNDESCSCCTSPST